MKAALILKCLGFLVLIAITAAPLSQTWTNPIFQDDFNNYIDAEDIQKSYIVWNDGAIMEVAIQNRDDKPNDRAMLVDFIAPNSSTQNTNGSIYHILSGNSRDWSDGSALRFWVSNTHDQTLLLSFNFKEAYNEYWAVADQGIFFFQNEENDLMQQNIEYGNIPIPADYQGWVLIPFYSFNVPEWNTARGNHVMDLQKIESFAISVTISDDYPRSFLIDDIEILPPSDFKSLDIQGAGNIQVPTSGEHLEQYSAYLFSPQSQSSQQVSAEWSLTEPHDDLITIDEYGNLTIPAGLQEPSVTIHAEYLAMESKIIKEFTVDLTGSHPATITSGTTAATTVTPYQPTASAYDQFSKEFEAWAVENRPLFIVLSIAVILLVLFLLTLFQRRLK